MQRRNFLKMIGGIGVLGVSTISLSSPRDETYESHGFTAFNEQIIGVLDELATVYPNRTVRICKEKKSQTHSVIMNTLTYNSDKTHPILARIDDTSPTVVWVYDIIDTGLFT